MKVSKAVVCVAPGLEPCARCPGEHALPSIAGSWASLFKTLRQVLPHPTALAARYPETCPNCPSGSPSRDVRARRRRPRGFQAPSARAPRRLRSMQQLARIDWVLSRTPIDGRPTSSFLPSGVAGPMRYDARIRAIARRTCRTTGLLHVDAVWPRSRWRICSPSPTDSGDRQRRCAEARARRFEDVVEVSRDLMESSTESGRMDETGLRVRPPDANRLNVASSAEMPFYRVEDGRSGSLLDGVFGSAAHDQAGSSVLRGCKAWTMRSCNAQPRRESQDPDRAREPRRLGAQDAKVMISPFRPRCKPWRTGSRWRGASSVRSSAWLPTMERRPPRPRASAWAKRERAPFGAAPRSTDQEKRRWLGKLQNVIVGHGVLTPSCWSASGDAQSPFTIRQP